MAKIIRRPPACVNESGVVFVERPVGGIAGRVLPAQVLVGGTALRLDPDGAVWSRRQKAVVPDAPRSRRSAPVFHTWMQERSLRLDVFFCARWLVPDLPGRHPRATKVRSLGPCNGCLIMDQWIRVILCGGSRGSGTLLGSNLLFSWILSAPGKVGSLRLRCFLNLKRTKGTRLPGAR